MNSAYAPTETSIVFKLTHPSLSFSFATKNEKKGEEGGLKSMIQKLPCDQKFSVAKLQLTVLVKKKHFSIGEIGEEEGHRCIIASIYLPTRTVPFPNTLPPQFPTKTPR